jgi:hypothetical protein
LVICTDTNAFELEPTVLLVRELRAAGIAESGLAIALNKVLDGRRERIARDYLAKAGMQALPVALRFQVMTHDIGNEGRAVTEAPQKAVREPAEAFFKGIVDAFERARDIEAERERAAARDRDRDRDRDQEHER